MYGIKIDSQSRWLRVDKLLDSGQYTRVAELLLEFQTTIEQTSHSDLKNLTVAARQICLVCHQCQIEIEWHRKANQEIRQRVGELEQQLHTFLILIQEYDYDSPQEEQLPATPVTVIPLQDRNTPAFGEHPTLWQRIQDLFGLEPEPSTSERQPTGVGVEASFTSPVEKDERLAHLDSAKRELPPPPTSESGAIHPDMADESENSTPIREEAGSVEEIVALAISHLGPERKNMAASPIVKTSQSRETPPSLIVYCLGPLRVHINRQPVEKWPSNKGKSIFKYLIGHREHPIHRDILIDMFWQNADPEMSRRNLYQAIYNLRQSLQSAGPEFDYILQEEGSYCLNPSLDLWVDNEAFAQHYQTGQDLERDGRLSEAMEVYELAERLYKGEYFAEERYEDWPIIFRENLKQSYLDLLDRLSRYYLDEAEMTLSITYCQKIINQDNCREDAHRRLMRCYMYQGQRHLAIRQYHICSDVLRQELNVSPMPATKNLYHEIQTN